MTYIETLGFNAKKASVKIAFFHNYSFCVSTTFFTIII